MTRARDRGPLLAALGASLALHGAALAAVLWGWAPSSQPKPVATRTMALVIVDGPPVAEPTAPLAAKPMPEKPRVPAAAIRSAVPTPTMVAAHHAPPPKPMTPDPRTRAIPVFKPPPRRPVAPPAEPPTPAAKSTAVSDPHRPPAQHPASPSHRQQAALPAAAAAGAAQTASPPRYGVAGRANPRPRYPWLARQRGEQGRVVIRVAVDAQGTVTAVTVTESSGHGRLDRAALRALRRWRFEPARHAGRAVPGTVDVPITFRLDDEG